ncbi:MAG: neutral/alkaline non-lysosomal ceramidase N-terminal domain-containing protein [Pirellula sp.]
MTDTTTQSLDGLTIFSFETISLKRWFFFAILIGVVVAGQAISAEPWKAGVASVDITPKSSIWMAGYASRKGPSEGVLAPLYAKVLVIEDSHGKRCALVTSDLIGIPRKLRELVAAGIASKYQLDPAGLVMNCSHTHCGPVVRDDLEMSVMYPLETEQRQRVEAYFAQLHADILRGIGLALDSMAPAKIGYSHARCGFAMNRRLPTKNGFQNSPYPDGPVDHDVPVLRVDSMDGKLRAVMFGYACHNTSTALNQINADYAGFAQQAIESAHPGSTALFVLGCGGDQNPYPRGKIENAQAHGASLATAVEAALLPEARAFQGELKFAYQEIDLPFAPISKEETVAASQSKDLFEQRRATALLHELEQKGTVRASYPYPVQVIQFGDQLTMFSLGGEVVVDYSIKLKQAFGRNPVWVAGYSNDVMAYIPSERILSEGGYEGGGAMRYSNLPGPWRTGVESMILSTIDELVAKTKNR